MITAGNEYNGNETLAVIVRPQFIGMLPPGMAPVLTEGAGSVKLTFFGTAGNKLVKYSSGFQGGVDSTKKQKKFELGEWKSENSWTKQDYSSVIQRQAEDIKSAFQNDIFKSEFASSIPFGLLGIDPAVEPTTNQLVSMAEYLLQTIGIAQGIFEAFFLADPNSIVELDEGAGTFPNGVTKSLYAEDVRFSSTYGVWTRLMAAAATTPTIDQVKKIAMSNAAVAKINTVTLTGTSGTATVLCKGVSKIATFDTDLATTAAAFVSAANITAYAANGVTLSYPGSGAAVVFTSVHAGVDFDNGTSTNATGDLAGTTAESTANTDAADLAAGEALSTFRLMVKGQPKAMKSMPKSRKVLLATDSFIENYQESLGAAGSNLGTSESARGVMVNGTEDLKFNGITIWPMPIDAALEAYAHPYPHRAILTVPENIAPVLSSAGKFAESLLWFNKDENENRTRTQLEMGGDYFLPELSVVAY